MLSGMNSMAMIQENIRIADTVKVGEMTETDGAMFEDVRNAVNEKMKVPCTGCGYCQPCPYGVDIPGAFRCYNVRYTDNFFDRNEGVSDVYDFQVRTDQCVFVQAMRQMRTALSAGDCCSQRIKTGGSSYGEPGL